MAERARKAKLRNAFIKASKNRQIANAEARAAKNAKKAQTQTVINRMAERARQAKMRNRLLRAANKMKAANAEAKAAKNAEDRNAALAAAKKAREELNALKAAANTARATKIAELRRLINGLNVSNLFENQQKTKLNTAKIVLGNNASNIKTINASINQLKVVTTAVRVRKNAAAEEEKRKKAEEEARKKELTTMFGTNNYNFNKFRNANGNIVNKYAKLVGLRRNFMNAPEANSLLKPANSLMNANTLTAMIAQTQKNRREALGIPIIVGVFNPGKENTTNHVGMKFANGSIKLKTGQTSLNMNAIIRNSIPSLGDIFSPQSDAKNVGIILMGSSGSGKTYFANDLLKDYLKKSGYTPSTRKIYYGGAYVDGKFVQQESSNGNEATIFNTGIDGFAHCAPTPFNPRSSRAQEITTYRGHGRNIHVIDMAGNEDILELYTAYTGDGSMFNLTRLLSNIMVNSKRTPNLNIRGKIPIIDIAFKYKGKLIEMYDEYSSKGMKMPTINYKLGDTSVRKTLSTKLNGRMKRGALKDGLVGILKGLASKDSVNELNKAMNSLAYITARCSEGIYITSTMRALIRYLYNYREQDKTKRNRAKAMRNAINGYNVKSIPMVFNDNNIRKIEGTTSAESKKAMNAIGENANIMKLKGIITQVQGNKPYTLSETNKFLEEVAKYDNTVLFPLLFSGQNTKKLELAKQTYRQMNKLAKQKINRNNKQ